MDPNELLKRILENAGKIRIVINAGDTEDPAGPYGAFMEAVEDGIIEDVDQLTQDLEDFDESMRRGMVLPQAWGEARASLSSQQQPEEPMTGLRAISWNLDAQNKKILDSRQEHRIKPITQNTEDIAGCTLEIHHASMPLIVAMLTIIETVLVDGTLRSIVGFRAVDEDLWVKQQWTILPE